MRKLLLLILLYLVCNASLFSQEGKKIDYTSDRTVKNEEKYPGAIVLSKVQNQVHFIHEGIEIWCDQAIHYDQENFFKAYGNVRMQQGDTVSMESKYAEYNGDTQFAFASGQVVMQRPQTTLKTDTLFFDRLKQQAYYRSGGKVIDTGGVITSNIGRYFLEKDKYSFVSEVKLTNPEYVITSEQLDFYGETGHAYLYGPSTIESESSTVYCERGFYDTRGDTGYFVKNSRIDYDNRTVKGDSMYFNRNTNFASATNNIEVIDTINESVVTGHYAEVFKENDSVFITKKAVAASVQDKDSLFIHSDTIMITGKPEKRIIRGFYDVRLYKSNMSGKSDSVHINQATGLTQMINLNSGPVSSIEVRRSPVLWSGLSQMTGDTIHLQSNTRTEQLDSLRVFNNAFLIQKDSIKGYNQVKGQDLVGLFENNELYQVDINKNTETLYYSRNSEKELIGINKTLSSSIKILFSDRQIDDIYYYNNVDGDLTPEEDFPINARKLIGFNWRGDERILTKQDLFKGQPEPELIKIEGIPLPEEQNDFFDEREEGEDMLLNEKSRLKPDDLKNREKDSIPQLKEPQKLKSEEEK
ncbi:OstA-like protein [Salegentibacter echinorum]|uniref:OstA-like protein n=1 Tax=Salegentibacter echinorum TaxID=1073325 RepID=A0A1M5CAI5_SALEC|nr:OstA-like protein [Salegentibacter echinorum]SHF51700.1 OstA-like protein [Salegentibacter echinorum]